MQLSSKQQEIVDSNTKHCFVIAGAGSGKTRTLTERVKKILSECRAGEKVLAITFSNKAATELQERLLLHFSNDELIDKAYVGTVHNFCMDLVLTRGHTIGLPSNLHIFESAEDRLQIFIEALNSIPQLKEKYTDQKQRKALFDNLSKAKREFRFPSDLVNKPKLRLLYEEYNSLMLQQNAIDFDDILLYAYRILADKESVARIYQRIYKYIFIDEAQDLNKSQYQVIKVLAGDKCSLFMVGDPNQAIYGFNGSSSKYMCDLFPKEYNATKYVLDENFRSSQSVINAAKLIEPSFQITGKLPIVGACEIRHFENEEGEADWIIEKLNSLIGEGHPDIEGHVIGLEQCAILARNKYVFNKLTEKLDLNNITYHLRSSANQGLNSESTIFKIFDLSLRLIINEKDLLHFNEMIKLLNVSEGTISSYDDLVNSSELDCKLGTERSHVLRKCWSLLNNSNSFRFEKVIQALEEFCENESNFTNEDDRLLSFNDLATWKERWEIYVRNTALEDRNLANLIRSIALGITTVTNEKGLTLSTVHMSKGLEFDVVFIMGITDGTFPDYRALNDEAQLEEEKHNMFVSITRSKRLCYLTYPHEKVMPWGDTRTQSPSRYLLQLGFQPSYT